MESSLPDHLKPLFYEKFALHILILNKNAEDFQMFLAYLVKKLDKDDLQNVLSESDDL